MNATACGSVSDAKKKEELARNKLKSASR